VAVRNTLRALKPVEDDKWVRLLDARTAIRSVLVHSKTIAPGADLLRTPE
jgi:hypothetical protein